MPTNNPIEPDDSEQLPGTTEKVQELTEDDLKDITGGMGSGAAGVGAETCLTNLN